MVHELKKEFMQVLQTLTVIQDDNIAVKKKLADMSQTLESVQSEMSCLSSQLAAFVQTQESLEEKVRLLQAERNLLVEELLKTGAISERVKLQLSDMNGATSNSGSQGESDHQLHHSREQQVNVADSSVEDGIMASACKCLNLLQALEEKCLLPELPDSSDEDAFQEWSQSLERRDYKDEKSCTQQSFPSPNSNPTDVQRTSDAERQEAVQAIIDSEKEYISRLWSLLDGYLGPLQEGHVISTWELSLLLPPYLQQMYDQHGQIQHLLQERLLHWNWSGIVGDVLARVTDTQKVDNLMSLYQNYLSDFPAIVSCLRRQLAQSRQFRMFIKVWQYLSLKQGIHFKTLYTKIKPFQDIPAYCLQN
ncbi:rho guanine nucleotide exchange factor 33-like isoform X2 [Gigantopelta aegis]|nr:rho guanine nucleotide exchange factor 33-like isoform X2 [Gigantopelta aegis]